MPIGLNSFGDQDEFFTERYKVLIRSNKEFLLRTATVVPLLDRVDVHVFRYDIYRLLRTLGVDQHLHWTTAFLNGIINPNQDIIHLKELHLVDMQVISKLLARNNTIKE